MPTMMRSDFGGEEYCGGGVRDAEMAAAAAEDEAVAGCWLMPIPRPFKEDPRTGRVDMSRIG